MLKNYLKIAIRNLYRQKTYAFINISGLALGLVVALVIGMFARHKLSYDRYHPEVERLYRVIQTGFASTPPGLAKALEDRYPEFDVITEVSNPSRYLLGKTPEETFYISDIITADEHFFEVFPYPVLAGNPETMLNRPGQMVLTRSLAKQLFGAENPLGRTLTVEAKSQYEITGVIEDIPPNSHFRFQAILSLTREGRQARFGEAVKWPFYGDYLYARLHPNTELAALEAKMTVWANAVHPYKPKDFGLFLQPITEIHLHSKLGNEIAPQSDIRYLYFFAVLALVVLAVACFNYMNLATARAMHRMQEIGVRKVCGATRAQLIRQFLAESLLFSLIALPLALGLAEAAIPAINRWAGEAIAPGLTLNVLTLAALAGIILLVGLAAGSYPALFLSSFRPATILGKSTATMKGGFLRKIFVVCQFAATVMLVFATLTIWSQLDYIRNKRLGFEKDYVVTFSSHFLGKKYQAFKQTLLQSPYILAVSSGPATGIGHLNMSTLVASPETGEKERLGFLNIDYDYTETLGLELKEGRTFSPAYPSDARNGVILNEAAAKLLDIADTPVGKMFESANSEWRVVGVVADFHNRSLKSPVQPIVFALAPGHNWTGLVRLNPSRSFGVQAGLTALQKAWQQFVPGRPFEYAFLSDRIARQYKTEQRLAGVFTLFAGMAIFIACLGLFGLASFAAEQRTKEIGIRKVLGASVASILSLLSKDFVKLVLLANLIAWPVAWYAMNKWLENFAYRIDPVRTGWWIFPLAGGLALLIALLTVSTQAVRAALANPVENLRYE